MPDPDETSSLLNEDGSPKTVVHNTTMYRQLVDSMNNPPAAPEGLVEMIRANRSTPDYSAVAEKVEKQFPVLMRELAK